MDPDWKLVGQYPYLSHLGQTFVLFLSISLFRDGETMGLRGFFVSHDLSGFFLLGVFWGMGDGTLSSNTYFYGFCHD